MLRGWRPLAEVAREAAAREGCTPETIRNRLLAVDRAAGVGQDQFGAFTILVGTLPSNTSKVVFKAVQTYSDGTVTSWIEPVAKGAPEPEHPTPVLKLVK